MRSSSTGSACQCSLITQGVLHWYKINVFPVFAACMCSTDSYANAISGRAVLSGAVHTAVSRCATRGHSPGSCAVYRVCARRHALDAGDRAPRVRCWSRMLC
eukprot:802753-Rhodomonas_salina.1